MSNVLHSSSIDKAAPARIASAAIGHANQRVLFVVFTLFYRDGGIERFNRRVVRALTESDGGPAAAAAAARPAIDVLALWDGPEHTSDLPQCVNLVRGSRNKLSMILKLARLSFAGPQIILFGHVLLWPLAMLTRLLRPGSRQALFVHGIEVWDRPSWLKRFSVAGAFDHIVSVSQFSAGRMQANYRLPSDRFSLLPNATDVEEDDSALAAPSSHVAPSRLNGDAHNDPAAVEHRLLTVCRLAATERLKNVDVVVRAMPAILKRFPRTHYHIVGDGELQSELSALAEKLGVGERVHLLGRVDDRRRDALYATSHIFALPSSKEGFGIVFLEAWKFAVPTICGTQDAGPEVVRDGIDGFCVDPTPEAVAAAACRLMADEPLRQRMGQSGRQRLLEHYRHERFRRDLHRILELLWPALAAIPAAATRRKPAVMDALESRQAP